MLLLVFICLSVACVCANFACANFTPEYSGFSWLSNNAFIMSVVHMVTIYSKVNMFSVSVIIVPTLFLQL